MKKNRNSYLYLTDYNPTWVEIANERMTEIRDHLKDFPWFKDIQHIGSTAIQGMEAKPMVDLMIGVDGSVIIKEFWYELMKIGYRPHESKPDFLSDYSNSDYAVTVHIVLYGSALWELKQLFRDHFIKHPQEIKDYTRIKRDAMSNTTNWVDYTVNKQVYIASVLMRYGYTMEELIEARVILPEKWRKPWEPFIMKLSFTSAQRGGTWAIQR